MITSTSSHNVQLTDELRQFVEQAVRKAFGRIGQHVESVDARLECHGNRDRNTMKAVVRADLYRHRPVTTAILDDDLYAAVRRGVADAARAADRVLQRSEKLSTSAVVSPRPSLVRYTAANV